MPDEYGYHNVSIYGNTYCLEGHDAVCDPETPQAIIRETLYNNEYLKRVVRGRIYDMQIPKDITMPCITLQRISETLDRITLVRKTVYQVDCYSESHVEAGFIAETVLSVLTNSTYDRPDLDIYIVSPETLTDLSAPETRLYRVTGDYAVIWRSKKW